MALIQLFILGLFLLGLLLGPILGVLAAVLYGERGRSLARVFVSIGLRSIYRPAITFNGANELTLKKRTYDENHDQEKIGYNTGIMGKVYRFLSNPQDRIHLFMGTPFALVDELFGVVFDPRDVAVGRRLRQHQQDNGYVYEEVDGHQLTHRVRGVFGFDEGRHGAFLPDFWTLVGGSGNATINDRIEELYEIGQAPKNDATAIQQMLIPVGAALVILFMGALFGGSGGATGGGGGGGAPTRNVTVGLLFLLLSLPKPSISKPPRPDIPDVSAPSRETIRDVFATLVFVGIAASVVSVLLIFFPMPMSVAYITLPVGVWGLIAFGFGMVTPAFVASWFGRGLGPIGMLLGKLWVIVGMQGFRRPVISLQGNEYVLVEAADVEFETEPYWYRFAFTKLGFDFENHEDAWPGIDTVLTPNQVDEIGEEDIANSAPPRYLPATQLQSGGHTGFVPKNPDKDVYVQTKHATGWYRHVGKDTTEFYLALEEAKRKFGGGTKPLSDAALLGATVLSMAMSMVFNWVVFF